jgi:hypothetical protein
MEQTEHKKVIHLNHNYQMFLRDQFAQTAMLGILNNGLTINDKSHAKEAYKIIAENAYLLADEMLKQSRHGGK